MKRLFLLIFAAIGGAIAVWLFSRRRMDGLYGEVSRLREIERKYDVMVEKEAQLNAVFREDIEEMKRDRANRPPLTTEQKLKMAMLEAVFDADAREKLGEHYIEDEEDDS